MLYWLKISKIWLISRFSAIPCSYHIFLVHTLYCFYLSSVFIILISSNGLWSSYIPKIFTTRFNLWQIWFIFYILTVCIFFLFTFLLKKNLRFMIVKTNEIEVQIFNTIFFENILAANELAQIEIIQHSCFSHCEKLLIIQSRLFSFDSNHYKSRVTFITNI